MSTAIAPIPGAGESGPVAAGQRVAQLQALVAQAGQGSTAGFAAALEAASASAGSPPSSIPPAAQATAASPASYSAPTAYPSATPGAAIQPAAYMSSGVAPTPADAPTAPATGSSTSPYDAQITQAASRYGIDPALLHGLIQQESGFDPNAHSSSGALGLTQLMPGTASSMGISNPLDPLQSIEGGARYLSEMLSRFGGNTADALAAYNAGPGAVSRYGGVPPYAETQDYVSKVMGYANTYRQTLSAPPASGSIA